MLVTFLVALAISAVYGNIGYDLTSKEKAKSGEKDWDKFNSSWIWMMLYLPLLTFTLYPALHRHRKRIKAVAAQRELDGEEYPKLLEEGKQGAERAAKGIPDPEPDNAPEPASPLNQALVPQALGSSPKEPSDK